MGAICSGIGGCTGISPNRAHFAQVSPIVENVRANGDAAVREYTAKFDRVNLDSVCVPIEVWMGGALRSQGPRVILRGNLLRCP